MSIIRIENLKYKYPNTDRLALDGITLSIEKGEFIGIAGANGEGYIFIKGEIIKKVKEEFLLDEFVKVVESETK